MNTNLTDTHVLFLRLVRLGLGHTEIVPFTDNVDWIELKALANTQGLSAIVLDGLNYLRRDVKDIEGVALPPKAMTLQWIGEVLQSFEVRYKAYERAIGSLAKWYNCHGFKMMVLKGYACSLDWPKPEYRPCGDIDIWLFGEQKNADRELLSSFRQHNPNFRIDSSHHHHTVFEWLTFTVENHYDFVNVHAHKSSAELEKVFKELGSDASHFVEVLGEKVYLPSPNLHALFLIRHMVSHFSASEITLRQVLDWGFFVEKHGKEVDWDWLFKMLEKYHMKEFMNCINAICVGDLWFDVKLFQEVKFIPVLKDRVLADILDPAYGAAEPGALFPRLLFKYRRWQGNAWKQRLCYSESRWNSFWRGIWAKILKPSSF